MDYMRIQRLYNILLKMSRIHSKIIKYEKKQEIVAHTQDKRQSMEINFDMTEVWN